MGVRPQHLTNRPEISGGRGLAYETGQPVHSDLAHLGESATFLVELSTELKGWCSSVLDRTCMEETGCRMT